MTRKETGPAAHMPTGPKQATEAARLIKSKIKELESQEAKLFLKFAESYPPADLKIDAALAVWNFLKFLKKNDYIILYAKRMVRLALEID